VFCIIVLPVAPPGTKCSSLLFTSPEGLPMMSILILLLHFRKSLPFLALCRKVLHQIPERLITASIQLPKILYLENLIKESPV
jgi:hypothetical protein